MSINYLKNLSKRIRTIQNSIVIYLLVCFLGVSRCRFELWILRVLIIVASETEQQTHKVTLSSKLTFVIQSDELQCKYRVPDLNSPVPELWVRRLLLRVDVLLIWASTSLNKTQAGVSAHGGVHLIS